MNIIADRYQFQEQQLQQLQQQQQQQQKQQQQQQQQHQQQQQPQQPTASNIVRSNTVHENRKRYFPPLTN